MIYRILAILLFLLLCQIFTSCSQNSSFTYLKYGPPAFIEEKLSDPQDDYRNLKELFQEHHGNMTLPGDRIVKWKDTKYFRLFEFKHHSIVIFPHNWNRERYNLYIFAGHVKNYDNLLKGIFFTCKTNDQGVYYVNETMMLDPDIIKYGKISFDGFFLGEQKGETYINAKRLLKMYYNTAESLPEKDRAEQFDYFANKCWPEFLKDNTLSGFSDYNHFLLKFINDKNVWMQFRSEGCANLGSLSIFNRKKLKILDQGSFKIPRFIDESQ